MKYRACDIYDSPLFVGTDSAIEEAAKVNASAIGWLGLKQEEIAEENRKNRTANTKELIGGIIKGTEIIERGLKTISGEIANRNIIEERRDLNSRIASSEEWLFRHRFLKEFYETVELTNEIMPYAENKYGRFLSFVAGTRNERYNELKKEEANYNKLEYLKVTAMRKLVHPMFVLAELITKQGLRLSERYVDIISTEYSYKNLRHYAVRMFLKQEASYVEKYGDYYVSATLEVAIKYLILEANEFEKENTKLICAEEMEWDSFFSELNMNIAIFNLRILAQKLEEFKRKKMIDLC